MARAEEGATALAVLGFRCLRSLVLVMHPFWVLRLRLFGFPHTGLLYRGRFRGVGRSVGDFSKLLQRWTLMASGQAGNQEHVCNTNKTSMPYTLCHILEHQGHVMDSQQQDAQTSSLRLSLVLCLNPLAVPCNHYSITLFLQHALHA